MACALMTGSSYHFKVSISDFEGDDVFLTQLLLKLKNHLIFAQASFSTLRY